jgi:hypothetical protein
MRFVVGFLAIICGANLALLVTDWRVLIHERKVTPGETYEVEGWGNLGSAQQSSLACRYWTGRSVVVSVLWYSSNNVMGRDQCPFIRAAN